MRLGGAGAAVHPASAAHKVSKMKQHRIMPGLWFWTRRANLPGKLCIVSMKRTKGIDVAGSRQSCFASLCESSEATS